MSFTDLLKRLAALKTMRPAATGSWCQLMYGGPADCPYNPMLKVAHTCGREKTWGHPPTGRTRKLASP